MKYLLKSKDLKNGYYIIINFSVEIVDSIKLIDYLELHYNSKVHWGNDRGSGYFLNLSLYNLQFCYEKYIDSYRDIIIIG